MTLTITRATAAYSRTVKVPKAEYQGEERYRPHEDHVVYASLEAEDPDGVKEGDLAALRGEVEAHVNAAIEAITRQPVSTATRATPPQQPPTTIATSDPPTASQLSLLRRLAQERGIKDAPVPISKTEASQFIDEIKALPSPGHDADDYEKGAHVKARELYCRSPKCSGQHGIAGTRIKLPGRSISRMEWDHTIRTQGQPLCHECNPTQGAQQ